MVCVSAGLNIVAFANPTVVCVGQSTVISASGGASYVWDNGLGAGASHTVSPNSNTTYTVTATDNYGCSGTTSVVVNAATLPHVDFSGTPVSGCMPLLVSFNNQSDVGTYLWSFGDGNSSSSANPQHTYTQSGSYSVSLTVTSTDGCDNVLSFVDYVRVFPLPLAAFSAQISQNAENESTYNFINNSIGANSWLWNFGTGSSADNSSEQNLTFNFGNSGAYTVILFAENQWGCTDSTSMLITVNPMVTFYVPSAFTPNGDGFNDYFQGYGTNISEYKMLIFDRWGDLLFETDDYNQPWYGRSPLTNEFYMSGVYVYKFIVKDFEGIVHNYYGTVTLLR